VEPQTRRFTILDKGEIDFILTQFLGVGWRKLNAIAVCHPYYFNLLLVFLPSCLHSAALPCLRENQKLVCWVTELPRLRKARSAPLV
jgi:hypothetical protein